MGDKAKENLQSNPGLTPEQQSLIAASLTPEQRAFAESLPPKGRAEYYEEVAALNEEMAKKRAALADKTGHQTQVASAKASGVNKWGDVDPTSMLG